MRDGHESSLPISSLKTETIHENGGEYLPREEARIYESDL